MPSIHLTPDHGYVGLAASSMAVLHIWLSAWVGALRKKAGIKYPQLYAEKSEMENNVSAKIFNCVQRAHGNTQEITPNVLFSLGFSGLFHPRLASSLVFGIVVFRVIYALGYATGDPSKRLRGFPSSLFGIALHILNIYTSIQLVRGAL